MNLLAFIWRCVIIFVLNFSMKRSPLFPAACQIFKGLGYLTVEPGPVFRMGSDITVYCHLTERICQWRTLSLELNGHTVDSGNQVNCITKFKLHNVSWPRFEVLCKLRNTHDVVSGLNLQSGLPPQKPKNIMCETSKMSEFLDCSWNRGQQTHLPTTYNISICRENGTLIHLACIQDAGKFTMPRAILDKNTKYHMVIVAHNQLGQSQSDPFVFGVNDRVVPETPRIIQIKFGNHSTATLRWNSSDSPEHLRTYIRLRTVTGSWEERDRIELSDSLIRVDDLQPLTEYEFQMRACYTTPRLTPSKTPRCTLSTNKSLCSKWSRSIISRSPGKGPSQLLHVWRKLEGEQRNGFQMVTVFWKPPSAEDYSGEVEQYEIFLSNNQKEELSCAANLSQCSIPVPPWSQVLRVSAVTLYGKSPPADVPLTHSGAFGPVLRGLAPADNGRAVIVSWLWPAAEHWLPTGKLLYYVIEWTSGPAAGLNWTRLAKEEKSTSITGLNAGVRYNVSLYAVTTRGVSAPSSGLVYSKQEKPISGPNVSVLVHEARRILIKWEELAVDQQKGFITNYTIYLRALSSRSTELSVTVTASGPRQMWLDTPGGALVLQMTASTSAGEGPPGNRASSQPEGPVVGLLIVIVFIITFLMAIIANLLCWRCVRERIKEKCREWGPACLSENLVKLENSIAVKLLEESTAEPSFWVIHSDPSLSLIEEISKEETEDMYPVVHTVLVGLGQPTEETTGVTSDPETLLSHGSLEHVCYKPHTSAVVLQEEESKEMEEEQRDVPAGERDDRCMFEGLLCGLLSSVQVDFSSEWNSEDKVDTQSADLQQSDSADARLPPHTLETILTSGYFPQGPAANSTTA